MKLIKVNKLTKDQSQIALTNGYEQHVICLVHPLDRMTGLALPTKLNIARNFKWSIIGRQNSVRGYLQNWRS